jgi:peptidoglycan/LPS O-acetylase OafA/YrhL
VLGPLSTPAGAGRARGDRPRADFPPSLNPWLLARGLPGIRGRLAVMAVLVEGRADLSEDQLTRPVPRKRFRPLDGLRALAIGLVFAEHFGGWRPGTLGVDIFFVLSGYLITGLLVTEYDSKRSVSFRAFYRRRALRLLPAYVAMIGGTFLAVALFGDEQSTKVARQGLVQSLTYSGNITTALRRWDNEAPRLWEFAWSLAAEEQFYLLWPIVLVIGLRLAQSAKQGTLLAAGLFAVFLASMWWSYHLVAEHAPVMRIAVAPDTRSSALILGCAASLWESSGCWTPASSRSVRRLARWSGVAIGVGVLWHFPSGDAYGQARMSPLMAIGTALLIVGLSADAGRSNHDSLAGTVLGLRPLAFVGRLSYNLYLYNVLAILLIEVAEQKGFFEPAPDFGRLAAVTVAITLALVSYACVEQPFLRFRDRIAAARVDNRCASLEDRP